MKSYEEWLIETGTDTGCIAGFAQIVIGSGMMGRKLFPGTPTGALSDLKPREKKKRSKKKED